MYLKVAATAKHYALHSGPGPQRHRFDAKVWAASSRPASRACGHNAAHTAQLATMPASARLIRRFMP